MDLYVSFLEDNGEIWTEPRNLGNVVNTASDESSVFLASDGKTLYFSSDGHNGYGLNDIFVSRRVDSTWKLWTEPQNLGPVINTTGWDAYFSVPASGKHAVFVSSENTFGKQDLFRIPMKAGLRPNPVILVSGKVLDASTNKPLQAEIRFEKLENGKEMGIARSNPTTGEYKISLPAGILYGLRAEVDDYIPINESIDTRDLVEYEERSQNLLLIPLKKDQVVRLNNIFFDTGESELKKESLAELQRVVTMLQSKSSMKIQVMGHTDNVGEKANNKKLSQDRANSVMTFLVQQGIAKERLSAVGFGDSKPIAPNTTEVGKRKNRRVEFKITSSDGN
jgi:outer membrane protein OmpA-like peptidoglycan-associated protein